jgi:16S rRNA (guanine527-N7)-methyltransferase
MCFLETSNFLMLHIKVGKRFKISYQTHFNRCNKKKVHSEGIAIDKGDKALDMEVLRRAMKAMDIEDNLRRMETFAAYRDLVLAWNEKVNLTAIKDPDEFEIKHFVDSLAASAYPEFLKAKKIIDVGTGAGFPGLPLAICFPEKEFVLVDSLNKRIRILNDIIKALGVENATGIHGRAEDLAMQESHREKYDICISRAVADLSVLAEYCLPFVRVGGYFAAYKSEDIDGELSGSKKALNVLGGRKRDASRIPLEGIALNHQILWIEKTAPTPAKYPRKAGTPSKQPIK